ncbi:putative valacyclovir hydrolase [Coniella lustricola]|uniref:Putative valacyclovir hydrolase n=1 Tax=Coniella lustricola TaxID=2025994 RepID=A0A2T3A748_9PEZI|nr:putative valacyclovir hydrolase [Coniella lustricola]
MAYQHHLPLVVIPRPTTALPHDSSAIPAPTEESMVQVFGKLLPPATYLTTPYGRAAYYVYPPRTAASEAGNNTTPRRILMIHGVQTPALGLHPLATALRNLYPAAEIASVDLWGHGLTDTPLAPHVPALFHSLIDTVLEALQWREPVHLVGYSFGGSLAAGYAALQPQKIATVVFVAPAGLLHVTVVPEEMRKKYGMQEPLEDNDNDIDELGARDMTFQFLEGGALVVPNDWEASVARGEVVAPAVRDWELKNHAGHAASVVAVFRDGQVFGNFASFRTAVENLGQDKLLGIVGEKDEFCGERNLADVGVTRAVVVSDAGHGLVRERVAEVAAAIKQFWGLK